MVNIERLGFFKDAEGIPEELIAKYSAPLVRLASRTRQLGELTLDASFPCHPGNFQRGRSKKIRYIVIHYTGGTGSALANVRYYSSTNLPTGKKASAHLFVGHKAENAKIYQSIAFEDTAYHAPGRNADSIGIEVCCHNNTKNLSAASRDWYFDDETVEALVKLVRALMEQYNIPIQNIIRHYDVTGKICPAMWVHDTNAWNAFKARLEEDEVQTSEIVVSMNGVETKLKTILYKGENYVRLRSLADADKDDKLTVDWNELQRKVFIQSK
jgi:hypothetical protein